jgi:hypothetical protein
MIFGTNTDHDDDDVVVTVPKGSPVIVPLMVDTIRPRKGVTMEILAADLSEDCKAQFDWLRGKRRERAKGRTMTENYRRARQEFICFMCLYGIGGIVSLVFLFVFLLSPVIHSKKWDHNDEYYSVRYSYAGKWEPMHDLRANPADCNPGNFVEAIKCWFFRDEGF